MDRCSLVLPAYVPNEELLDLTRKCLDSLRETTPKGAYELLVIDNGSTREASKYLHEQSDFYVYDDHPIGYAKAANKGLRWAHYGWLCVLNTDIEFTQEGWLSQLQEDYKTTPGGVLSAETNGRKGIIYDESWFSLWITKRTVLDKVGYFDESLPYRFHDQDLAIRMKLAGYEVMRTGNVFVKHVDSATYDTMGRNEDPEEAEEMVRRWGAVDFAEWTRLQASAPLAP